MDDAGITTLPCTRTVEQVLRRIVVEVEARGLEIFAVVDHSGEAAEAGLEMPETKLVIFGSPRGGTPLMRAHPLLALDLPLKLLIWERADGELFVSFNAPEFVATRYALTAAESDVLRVVAAIAASVTAS